MPLTPGTRLGPYEIVAPLGAGGMGEVFRAKDTRLGRDVAVKVLPQHLSANPEVRARFEREAKTISSLNHPNICTLFDVGREGETDYLVMELIEGETLAARIARGALPTPDVLRLGGQIADALDRAHKAGVTHRDLKPGNVMLTKSGAKLMDFGLARATGLAGPGGASGVTAAALTQSPTVAAPLTAEGTIVGTFQYMAPEQLEGKEADARSDLWALGCVLYEMATGTRAFVGSTQASLISAIMRDTPRPIPQLAPMAPPALDRLVRFCLAKDPEERIQNAHDLKLQLAGLAEGGALEGADTLPAGATTEQRATTRSGKVAWAIAALALLAAVAASVLLPRAGAPRHLVRTVIPAPQGAKMQIAGDDAGPPVLSPDGTRLVFTAAGQGGGARLWLRRMDELTARPLAGTDGATFPFWSRDGRSIGFFTPTHLKRLDLEGGAVISLAPANGARGGTWAKGGFILYAPGYVNALMRVPASGGTPVAVTTLDSTRESTHRWPQMLPDGKHFIYLAAQHEDPAGTSAIWYGSLQGGAPRRLLASPSSALFASGWLLFVRDSTLMAQRFDPGSGKLSGQPVSTAEVVQLDVSTWHTVLTASDNGLLIYGLGGRTAPYRITWFDRSGRALGMVGEPASYLDLQLSPDRRELVVELQHRPNSDIWLYDLATGVRRPLVAEGSDEFTPVWSPDGAWIAYADQRLTAGTSTQVFYQVRMVASHRAGGSIRVLGDSTTDLVPMSWTRDGRQLLLGRGYYRSGREAALQRLVMADRRLEPVLPISRPVRTAISSPDGRWIAFSSNLTGRSEVSVIATPPIENRPDTTIRVWQVSTAGGEKPLWRADARELYYMRPDGMLMAVAVNGTGSEFRVLSEQALFQAFQRPFVRSYDVSADGQRFVVSVTAGDGAAPLALVVDWTKGIRR